MSGEDMVNSPDHYNQSSIECIDAIRAALGEEGFVAYCRGNAIKYNWRAGHKFDSVEDLKKAAWYSSMAAGVDPRGETISIWDNKAFCPPKCDERPEPSEFSKDCADHKLNEIRLDLEATLNFEIVDDVVDKLRAMGIGACRTMTEVCVHKKKNCSECGLGREVIQIWDTDDTWDINRVNDSKEEVEWLREALRCAEVVLRKLEVDAGVEVAMVSAAIHMNDESDRKERGRRDG